MIGQTLRALRLNRGYSLRKLGKLAGISHSFISDIEHGRSNPSIPTIDKLTEALGVRPDVLWSGEVSNNDHATKSA